MGLPGPSVYTGGMPRLPSPRLLRRLALLSLLLVPLAGCGQVGKLFLRMPPVTFPLQLPPPVLRFADPRLPRCLHDAELAHLMSLPPGAPTVVAPEAVTDLPATAIVTDADGFQQEAPVPCALLNPKALRSGDLSKATLAPAAATGDPQ